MSLLVALTGILLLIAAVRRPIDDPKMSVAWCVYSTVIALAFGYGFAWFLSGMWLTCAFYDWRDAALRRLEEYR